MGDALTKKERCFLCGRDCSFMSFIEGVCLPCSDDLQGLGTGELTKRLLLCQREVNRLKKKLRLWEDKSYSEDGPKSAMREESGGEKTSWTSAKG